MDVDAKGNSKGFKKLRTDDEPSLKDLMEAMAKMQASMSSGFQSMNEVQTEMQNNQRQLQDRMIGVISEFKSFKDETEKKWAELDERLGAQDKKLVDRMNQIENDLKKVNGQDPWHAYSKQGMISNTAASGRTSSARSSGDTSSIEVGDSFYDPLKLWIKGFGRPIMRAKLISHFDELVQALPKHCQDAVDKHLIRGPAAVYAIKFKSTEAANEAFGILRAAELTWDDKVTGNQVDIKVFKDQKLEDRNANRAIGRMWKPIMEMMQKNGQWKQNMRLLNYNRQLWIVEEDEPYMLVRLLVKGAQPIEYNLQHSTKAHYKFKDEELERIVQEALHRQR